jgi:DinB family protein
VSAEGYPDAIVGVFDFAVVRFTTRLEGLSDDELFWEPVAGCWTVRRDAAGVWLADGDPEGALETTPVTTIAWRMLHLACHVLGGFATWLRDGGMPYVGDPDVPHTAAAARAALDRNWHRWREGMSQLDAAQWTAPIGEAFGEHATASTADLVLHVLDEFVHHAAEVSLLRDLYAARPLRAGAP